MISRARWSFTLLLSLSLLSISAAQTATSGNAPLGLKAALVLTPEFCATKIGDLLVGKTACAELEPALKAVFTSLTSVTESSSVGSEQVVLLPRVVGASIAAAGFDRREVIIDLEWTAKDSSGRIVWIGSVQGSARGTVGTSFAYAKNLRLIEMESAKDVAQKSATKIASAAELLKLSQLAEVPGPAVASAGTGDNRNVYTLEYVHSDRKWKHNLRTESYDHVSEYLSAAMTAQMGNKGFHRATSSEGVCCKLTVEVLTVKQINSTPFISANQGPGVDVFANLKFEDARGNLLYAKEYGGGARVAPYGMEKVETLMRQAVTALARSISGDESFDSAITKAINGGLLESKIPQEPNSAPATGVAPPNPPPSAPGEETSRPDPSPGGAPSLPIKARTDGSPKVLDRPKGVPSGPIVLITDSAVTVGDTGLTLLLKHMRFGPISGDVFAISGTSKSGEIIHPFTNDRTAADGYVAKFSSAFRTCNGSHANVDGYEVWCFQVERREINRSKGKAQSLGVIESNGRSFHLVAIDFHNGGACKAKMNCAGVEIELRDGGS